IEAYLLSHHYSFLGFCEHWLAPSEADQARLLNFSTQSHFSRTSSSHGGTMILTNCRFASQPLPTLEQLSIEKVCEVSAIYILSLKLHFITIYRPPLGNFDVFLNVLSSILNI